jgi:hypothetical protein
MITIDPDVFAFVNGPTSAGASLLQSLSLVAKLCADGSLRGNVNVEMIYVDSASRLYKQGESPKVLQRIQALEITSEGGHYEGVTYLRFGSASEDDLFETLEEI